MRLTRIEPRFVTYVPEVREEGVLYISIEYGAIVHSCCCGCGEKVSTPLNPAQWTMTYDGEHVSLSPSVGSGMLPCNSHYFITRNDVGWAPAMTKVGTAAAITRDRAALERMEPDRRARRKRSRRWERATRWLRR